jgi:hypothetical protein
MPPLKEWIGKELHMHMQHRASKEKLVWNGMKRMCLTTTCMYDSMIVAFRPSLGRQGVKGGVCVIRVHRCRCLCRSWWAFTKVSSKSSQAHCNDPLTGVSCRCHDWPIYPFSCTFACFGTGSLILALSLVRHSLLEVLYKQIHRINDTSY